VARARITSKGQITIPKEVRDQLELEVGDELDFQFDGDRLEVRPIRRRHLAEFRGLFPVAEQMDFAEERAQAWGMRARMIADPGSNA
jgi:antitoxin PrlF